MDLKLTIQERAELRRLAREAQPTVRTMASVLLARWEGKSYGEAGEDAGVSRQYAYQVCKRFVEGGRLECPQLQDRPKPSVPHRERQKPPPRGEAS